MLTTEQWTRVREKQWKMLYKVYIQQNGTNNLISPGLLPQYATRKQPLQRAVALPSHTPHFPLTAILHRLVDTHTRMIKTEEKAKVVASVWWEEFIQFLAALAILPWTIWKNRTNHEFIFLFQILLVKLIL